MVGKVWTRFIIGFGAFATISTSTFADVISYTYTLPAVDVPLDGTDSGVIQIKPFNTGLGTLENTLVSIATTYDYGGSVTANAPVTSSGLTQLTGTTATYDLSNFGILAPLTSSSAALVECPCSQGTFSDNGSITKTVSASNAANVPPLPGGNIDYTFKFSNVAPAPWTVNLTNSLSATVTITETYAATPPPSLLTLAHLANNVYYDGNEGFQAYNIIASNCSVSVGCNYKGFAANAYQTADGSQTVIAIRGTDFGTKLEGLKNAAADTSFGGNIPSTTLLTEVSDAVQFIKAIEQANPDTHITLDGHSLGGAVAQLIGQEAGLPTYAFNAPGAAQLFNSAAMQSALSPIEGQGESTTNVNYRTYGDQISLIGTPTGNTVTLPPPPGVSTNFSENGTVPQNLVNNLAKILALHSMSNLLLQIQNGVAPISSAGQPNLVQALEQDYVAPNTILKVGMSLDETIIFNVLDTLGIVLDPSEGTQFVLTEASGSPNFACIDLPAISGITSYSLASETGSTWSSFQTVQASQPDCFGAMTNGFDFFPLDSNGNRTVIPDDFLLALSFDTTGELNATLDITQPSSVQEPMTLSILLLPALATLYFGRRRLTPVRARADYAN